MTPEDVLSNLANGSYTAAEPYPDRRIAKHQLEMTAHLLIEIRAMNKLMLERMIQEPIDVNVCNTVYTSDGSQ